MSNKKPFSKDNPTKIPFSELVELIGTSCDYKFCIIDETIDDELLKLAAKHGIDLTGFKHVIEKTKASHLSLSENEKRKAPPMRGASLCYHGGNMPKPAPYVLIVHWFFNPLPRPTGAKLHQISQSRNIFIDKIENSVINSNE